MMAVIQGMCARISMVHGEGLAAVLRRRMPPALTYTVAFLVIVANTFNVGADLGGMAAATHAVAGIIPVDALVFLFGIALVAAQVFLSYGLIARIFKWLTLTLFAYVITAFIVHAPWPHVFASLVLPKVQFDKTWLSTLVGLLGTTITPYLFFWQSGLEVEEEKQQGRTTIAQRKGADKKSIRERHADINTGMIFSNAVAFFIVVTTAATLGAYGKHEIVTAQDAAAALAPLAGNFAAAVFMLGMIGTGMLAVPVLATSSAYVAAETFRFREGLNELPHRAPRFYLVIVAGILIGIAMNLLRVDPIKALFWSAIINGVAAVPLVGVVVWLGSDRRAMREWTSSPPAIAWGWATVALMGLATLGMFYFMAAR